MVIKFAVCPSCVRDVQHKLSHISMPMPYEKQATSAGQYLIIVNTVSDPKLADPKSLFGQAWSQLPGNKVGNIWKCPHSNYVAFEIPKRSKR